MADNIRQSDSHDLVDAAIDGLVRSRAPIAQLLAPNQCGVYAIYLKTTDALAPFSEGQDGLIYIGLSTNLAEREFEQHFASGSTGFSTLRRSLGAVLKSNFCLKAIPRAMGTSDTNVRNYRFTDDGEARLTTWMQTNLAVGVHNSTDYESLEGELVGKLRPLLNLTKWANPDRNELKRLRKICADEARAARNFLSVNPSPPKPPTPARLESNFLSVVTRR